VAVLPDGGGAAAAGVGAGVGLGEAEPAQHLPGSQERDVAPFCSSVPKLRIGERPRVEWALTVMEWLASIRASSSTVRM
jgi:hypothetical protein